MSFLNKIRLIKEGMGQNLSTQIHGDDAESGALGRGDGGSFYRRTQAAHPKAIMVRPAGATWEYNPVPVRPDVYHGEVGGQQIASESRSDLDSIIEGIEEIESALFG